jgi:hypothetical protein
MKLQVSAWALRAAVLLAGTTLAASAATLASGTISIDGTEVLVGPNRVFRNAVASVSGTPKPFPGTLACGGNCGFRTVTVAAGVGPVTVTITGVTNAVGLFYVGYLNSFSPAALATNYLGDPGGSASGTGSVTFTVDLATPSSFVLAVMNDTAGGAGTVTYTITGALPPTGVPAVSGVGLSVLAALLAASAAFSFRRSVTGNLA